MKAFRGTVHSVQFLRFLAATLVMVFHAYQAVAPGRFDADGHLADTAYLFGFGAVGVHVFFVISGYIMYLTTAARSEAYRPGPFLIRRAVRIYPTYWLFVALYLGVHAAIGMPYAVTARPLAGALLLWPADAPLVIGPAWTLSFELYFYLIFGLAMMAGALRGLIVLTSFFGACVVAGMLLQPRDAVVGVMTNTLLIEFVAGTWIARATMTRTWPRYLGWSFAALALLGFTLGLLYGYDRAPSAIGWGVPSAALLFGLVVLEASGGVPGTRWLSRLGDSSYVLYLSHLLVIDLLLVGARAWSIALPPVMMLPVIAASCVAIAHGFHRAVEKPMIRALHRLTTSAWL